MKVGFVVIGRNEGDRLVTCLKSVLETGCPIVYVDSGSTDQSIENARHAGAEIVELDLSRPFTAARARNAGFERLFSTHPALEYVHFVDGDCTLASRWLETGFEFMANHEDVAVVCGLRQERFPAASIYNGLCQREWTRPAGETSACGGDSLVRIIAFRQVNGFRNNLIAGEEPELCHRLRQHGWRVWRIGCAMTLHDAAISDFRPWWRRMIRAGHAYAEISLMYIRSPEKIWLRQTISALFWGLFLPVGITATGIIDSRIFIGLLLYPLQVIRIAIREDWRKPDAWVYGIFMMLAKFAETIGIFRFYLLRFLKTSSGIIEYK